jgi:hypothetical protein
MDGLGRLEDGGLSERPSGGDEGVGLLQPGSSVEAFSACRQLRYTDPWLDPNVMLRLVVRAAVVQVPDAIETLRLLTDPSYPLSKEAARTLSQKLRDPVTDLREAEVILTLALHRGDLKALDRLTVPAEFVEQHATDLTDAITRALASKDAERQRLAAELHLRLARTARLPSPSWDDLVTALRRAIEPRTREVLADLALHGAVQGAYPYVRVREALTGLLRNDEAGALMQDNDVIAARRALVFLHAVLGPIDIGPELLGVAFRKPIDGPALAKASSFLLTGHRIAADPPSEVRVGYLIDMGRRLVTAGVTSSMCKGCRSPMASGAGRDGRARHGRRTSADPRRNARPRSAIRRRAGTEVRRTGCTEHPGRPRASY